MKKLFAVAALSAMLSTPAFAADSDSESFDINANVAETCTMEGISDIELGTLSINTNSASVDPSGPRKIRCLFGIVWSWFDQVTVALHDSSILFS